MNSQKQFHFPSENIATLAELQEFVSGISDIPKNARLAVGSLIFDNDRVILIERGATARDAQGELEGVGGGIDQGETDLVQALRREISEEIGVNVAVDALLTVMTLPGSEPGKFWVVPIYLCRLEKGEPKIMEPEKIAKIHVLRISEIPMDRLSRFQKVTIRAYKEKFGNRPYHQA